MARMAQMQTDLMALAAFNPEFALDKLTVDCAGKRGEFSYALGLQSAVPAPAVVDAMVDQAVDSGHMVRDGDYVRSSLDFSAGTMTVNGTVVSGAGRGPQSAGDRIAPSRSSHMKSFPFP